MKSKSAYGTSPVFVLFLLFSAHAALGQVVSVSQLSCNLASLTSGGTATCTVTLSGAAPSGGTEVAVSSNNGILRLSGNSVTVPAGAASTTFTATAGTVAGNQTATLTATALNSVALRWSASGSKNLADYKVYRGSTTGGPYSSLATVGLLTAYTDFNVQNGQKYYYVTTAVSSSGTESVYSNEAPVTVPAGVSRTTTLSLAPAPVALVSLTCTPASLLSLGATTCTVALSGAAPAGGTAVSLASNNALLPVPAASVTVPAGSASATFTAKAGTIGSNQTATLTATLSGTSRTAGIGLSAATTVAVASLSCSRLSLVSNSLAWCTVKLNNAAPAGGITVKLSTNSALLSVPAVATIPEGLPLAVFLTISGTVTKSQTATITASANSSSAAVSLSLTP